jgi:hypothetical protein
VILVAPGMFQLLSAQLVRDFEYQQHRCNAISRIRDGSLTMQGSVLFIYNVDGFSRGIDIHPQSTKYGRLI